MTYVSERSVHLEETREEQGAEVVAGDLRWTITLPTRWTASFQDASLYPYGRITISRSGASVEVAKARLKEAVEAQGIGWSTT